MVYVIFLILNSSILGFPPLKKRIASFKIFSEFVPKSKSLPLKKIDIYNQEVSID